MDTTPTAPTTLPPGFATLVADTTGRFPGIRIPVQIIAPTTVTVIARAHGGTARTLVRSAVGAVAHVHPAVVR